MTVGRIGIIGGSGLGAELGAIGAGEERRVETPFGAPSGPIVLTEVDGIPVALLSRHGPGHIFNPSQVPYRANIYALKSLGVTHILGSTAVGSLREEIAPRHVVIPDQVIDKTLRRPSTFFDELAVHVELASPFCPHLRALLIHAGGSIGTTVHPRGTYVCMEGPQFSTRAESELHRSWGADLIGMTALPEAKLAREAELCYALISLPTDYDCWRPPPADLSGMQLLQEIISNLQHATTRAIAMIRRVLPLIAAPQETQCHCQSALELGIWTERDRIPSAVRQRLGVLLSKYLSDGKTG